MTTILQAADAMAEALRKTIDAFDPFMLKPVGAPYSDMRRRQEMQIEASTANRVALAAYEAARREAAEKAAARERYLSSGD